MFFSIVLIITNNNRPLQSVFPDLVQDEKERSQTARRGRLYILPTPLYIFFYSKFMFGGGRRRSLIVSGLDSGSSGPGSSPGRGHCVVFLVNTLYFHSASLYRGV